MRFAGSVAEGVVPITATFAVTDECNFSVTGCPGGVKSFDLTPVVAPNVPVELSASVTGDASFDIYLDFQDAESIRSSSKYDQGTETIDATLLRAASGTVSLVVVFYGPDYSNPQQSTTLQGAVHTVTRTDVVPAYVPVAVELGPGDTLNATGDGLSQLALFPPQGPALRVLKGPFNITLAADAPRGTYVAIAQAEEAVRLYGPNTTLSARLLEFTQSDTVDVAANGDTSWDLQMPGQPLIVGLQMESKGQVGQAAVLPLVGDHKVALQSPLNVEVLDAQPAQCGPTPWCSFALLGQTGWGYSSGFLDEHLVPGTYHATISMQASNDMQAFAWGLTVRAAA
jgi:hypothetical protein